MRIGELSERSGVPTKTIRYWEQSGLVAEPARTGSGYRDYHDDTLAVLRFVRSAQAAGFTFDPLSIGTHTTSLGPTALFDEVDVSPTEISAAQVLDRWCPP